MEQLLSFHVRPQWRQILQLENLLQQDDMVLL